MIDHQATIEERTDYLLVLHKAPGRSTRSIALSSLARQQARRRDEEQTTDHLVADPAAGGLGSISSARRRRWPPPTGRN